MPLKTGNEEIFTVDGIRYIKKRMVVPETFCTYFHPDGTSTSYEGKLVECEVVLHVREKPESSL